LSETRLLLKTLPADLQERQKYLDENKTLRKQYEDSIGMINTWVQDARKRLAVSEGGFDFENILATINEHKVIFTLIRFK